MTGHVCPPSSYALHDELARRPMIGTPLAFLTPPASSAPTRSFHGWTGIAFSKISDREPLAMFIANGPSKRRTRVTLERVVDAIYLNPALSAQTLAPGSRPEGEYRLSMTAAASLDHALGELSRLNHVV